MTLALIEVISVFLGERRMDPRHMIRALAPLGGGLSITDATAQADHDKPKGDKHMGPMAGLHAHFCGIHVAKTNLKLQIIAQHYCGMRNEDMHQCLIFDSTEKNARLLGVEYIV